LGSETYWQWPSRTDCGAVVGGSHSTVGISKIPETVDTTAACLTSLGKRGQNARETEEESKTALCCRQPRTGDLISDLCKLCHNPYFVVLLTLLRETRC